MKRSSRIIVYHGRSGYPVIHTAKNGRKYIMVRHPSGRGVKRLFEGSSYWGKNRKDIRRLML